MDEDLEEKTWDNTENVVRKLIREKLNVEEEIVIEQIIERAHQVGKSRASRHPRLMGQ